jgi:hypothetical protein
MIESLRCSAIETTPEELTMRPSLLCLVLTMACSGAPDLLTGDKTDAAEDAVEIGTEIQVDLTIEFDPAPGTNSEAKLFLLGWESIDERSSRPPQNTRPDFVPQELTDRLSGSRVQVSDFTLKAGLYYFAQYGNGMEPGPDFRSSDPAQPSDGSLVLQVTGSVVPSDRSSSQRP